MSVKEQMQRLHSCHLILAGEIKRICEKHGIRYFIVAGTLLGAIRHGGFIPWDDDMDIAMLRSDYERFIEVAKTELSDKFFLQSFETDESFGLPFAKLMLEGTIFTERSTSKNTAHKGIYVDIFPFDNVPDDPKKQSKQNKKLYFLKRLLLAKQNYLIAEKGQFIKALVYFSLKALGIFTSKKGLQNALLKEMKRYNGESTKRICLFGGAYGYFKESVEREWFTDVTELSFEDTSFSAPKKYIKYLEYFYGDYMALPPEDKRYNRHNVLKLEFGPYEN